MAQRDDQTLYFTQFGQHQHPGIGYVVGIDDAKDIAAPIEVADGGGEFRSCQTKGCALRLGGFALCLHDSDTPGYLFLNTIVAISRQLKNTQKAIG